MTLATPADLSLRLDDGLTAFAPTGGGIQTGYGIVGGVAKIYDTGSSTTLWKGVFAVTVTAIDHTNLDETYTYVIQGSNSSTFASGIQDLALVNLSAVEQTVKPLINQISTTIYRYLRVKKVVNGTTPSITALVFIQPLSALDTYTIQEVLTTQAVIAQNQSNVTTNFSQWANGTATGGPNSDGSYLLTDFNGSSTLVPSPQKLTQMSGACMVISTALSIPSISVPTGINLIKTNGYRDEGLGGAYYEEVVTAPTTGYKGTRWFETSNNRYFVLVKDQTITPFMFGAYGDGATHTAALTFATLTALQGYHAFATSLTQEMDFLAWQNAIYFGGHIETNMYTFKMCNSNAASQTPLICTAGLFDITASGSVFDFGSMTELTDSTDFLLNSTFSSSSNWQNATIFNSYEMLQTTFGSGAATMTDTGSQTHWTIRTSAADNNWTSICWSPSLSLYCAVGLSGGVMTSSNGTTWTVRTAASSNNWRSVCWSPELGMFCAVANSGTGTRVMTSTNGTTWTTRTSASDSDWRSVCWSPELGMFVAVAVSGTSLIMTSTNGTTWTAQTAPNTNQWISVCWSPGLGKFVAVATSGTGNRVMTSTNGTTWTAGTSAADNNWISVCWSPGKNLFVAVGASGTGNRVMTSPDGLAWTTRTSAADNSWYSVCWSANRNLFVAVAITGTGNRVMESKDGITWNSRTNPVNNDWFSVCYSPALDQFCSVSASGTGNRVMTAIIPSTYYNWGQQVTLSPGRYTLTAVTTATLGPSYYLGNTNPGYAYVAFFSTSPGEGSNPINRSAYKQYNLTPSSTSDSATITFDFQVTSTVTLWACFSGGGYASISVSSFKINTWVPNCAILATRDGAVEHFPIPRGIDGLELVGPTAYTSNGITGVRYKSFSNTDGNLIRFTNCMITAFGRGFSFGDGGYLTDFNNVNVYGCGTGIYTELGTFNAGENLRW